MKDNYGDKISVSKETSYGDPVVYLSVTADFDDSLTDAALTPAKARKLAKKLRRAADEVEGIERIEREEPFCWLALSDDEAKTLAVILGRIGGTTGVRGDPVTARKYADQIAEALRELGLYGPDIDEADPRFTVHDFERAIYFVGVAE